MLFSFTLTWAWIGVGLGLVCFAFAIWLGFEMLAEHMESRRSPRFQGLRNTLLWEGTFCLLAGALLLGTLLVSWGAYHS